MTEFDSTNKGALWKTKVIRSVSGKVDVGGTEYKVVGMIAKPPEVEEMVLVGHLVLGFPVEDSYEIVPDLVVDLFPPRDEDAKHFASGKLGDKGRLLVYINSYYMENSDSNKPMFNLKVILGEGQQPSRQGKSNAGNAPIPF